MNANGLLVGCRVLVVEDDVIIAMVLKQCLLDLGCFVVGPEGDLATALMLAEQEDIDVGILDVKIRGGNSYAIGETLRSRGIPFVLASGNADRALPVGVSNQARLTKPFTLPELEQCVVSLYRRSAQGGVAQRRDDPASA